MCIVHRNLDVIYSYEVGLKPEMWKAQNESHIVGL